jgi:hypothetical protein
LDLLRLALLCADFRILGTWDSCRHEPRSALETVEGQPY